MNKLSIRNRFFEKNNATTALNVLYAKKRKKVTQTVKNKLFLNDFKWRGTKALPCSQKNYPHY